MQKIIILVLVLFSFSAFSEEVSSQFKNESEVGMVITGGNSQTQTVSVKDQASYSFSKNLVRFDGKFLKASTSGVESAYKYMLGLRYERELSDRFSIYLGQSLEHDKFQSIRQRYATDLGGKYFFFKEEAFKWFSEVGYRFMRTNYFTYFLNENYARVYTEAERFFNKSVSMKLWIEFLPNITNSDAYKLNTELSLSAAISEIFSAKTAYLIRYDNKPASTVAFKTDSTFTTALVAKF